MLPWIAFVRLSALPREGSRPTVPDPETTGGEPMTDVVVLQEGEEPVDQRNFVLIEQIPAPRGAPRYRVDAQGVNDDGLVGIQKTVDSLELARGWADDITNAWRSRPPIYMRHPLGSNESGTQTGRA
jgi:hypothetical protein